MSNALVQECCRIYLGTPNVHPANTEATCPTCDRYWFVRQCEGEGEAAGCVWVCPAPGLGEAEVQDVDEKGKVLGVRMEVIPLSWGGSGDLGTAFQERKEDDTAVSTNLRRAGREPGRRPPA